MLETEPVSHPPTSHSITNQRPKHPPRDVKLNRRFQMGTTTLENLKKKGNKAGVTKSKSNHDHAHIRRTQTRAHGRKHTHTLTATCRD